MAEGLIGAVEQFGFNHSAFGRGELLAQGLGLGADHVEVAAGIVTGNLDSEFGAFSPPRLTVAAGLGSGLEIRGA